MNYLDQVFEAMNEYHMLPDSGAILVGLSGGADSVALLRALLLLRERGSLACSLSAAHLNHCLRGEESDRDEAFVRELCARWRVPLTVARRDVSALASGEGEEECGRRLRYEFFRQTARPGDVVATAHTLSDSTETVLLNLTRGCTLTGLRGIPPVADWGQRKLIRPLITCTRAENEAFCREQKLDFVTDSTNLTDVHRRNLLRHYAVPLLRELNPALEQAVRRMTDENRRDEDYLQSQTARAVRACALPDGYDIQKLRCLHPAVQYRAVREICLIHCGRAPEYRHVDGICRAISRGEEPYTENLPGGGRAYVRDGRLCCCRSVPESPQNPPETVSFSVPGCVWFGKWKISVVFDEKSVTNGCEKINNLLSYHLIDYDKIEKKLTARSRLPGDRVELIRRGCSKELRKLWNEAKVPPEERPFLPVICDEKGIVFAPFAGCDAGRAADSATQPSKRLRITMEKTEV